MIVSASINFLSILLFIVSLGLLVVVHELGHLSMAKLFKVYCMEFSIGFGPALFSKKRKNGETKVSIRCIPLGGYVSMYGEGVELPEGSDIPPERSLQGIKKWKRATIMAAGIVLNFVLGYVLFACNTVFFPQTVGTNQIVVSSYLDEEETIPSPAAQAGLQTGDAITKVTKAYYPRGLDIASVIETFDITSYQDLWNKALVYEAPTSANDRLIVSFTYIPVAALEEENPELKTSSPFELTAVALSGNTVDNPKYEWSRIGIENYTYQIRYSFGRALGVAAEDWWDSATAIVKTLGGLFVGKGFENVGGPIAILSVSSTYLDAGFGYYLMLWGMISVNLGLFNLLPFPGLDGWHLLVVAIEGIFRKEIPNKVKNAISLVGMILLFGLMAVIMVKDFINFL